MLKVSEIIVYKNVYKFLSIPKNSLVKHKPKIPGKTVFKYEDKPLIKVG